MERRSGIPTRQELERWSQELAEQRRLNEARERERQRREAQRRLDREQIQNNRRAIMADVGNEDRVIEFLKNHVTETSANVEYIEYLADNQYKRCKVYGPTQLYFVVKPDGDKVLRLEYKTSGFSIENIQLKYIAREEKFLIEFDGYLKIEVSFPKVDARGMAATELAADGTLTFTVPLTIPKTFEFDNDASRLIHYEKYGLLCWKPEDFKSWNDVD